MDSKYKRSNLKFDTNFLICKHIPLVTVSKHSIHTIFALSLPLCCEQPGSQTLTCVTPPIC